MMEIINKTAEICCALFLLTLFLALLYKREWTRSLLMIVLIFAGEILAVVTDLIFRILNSGKSTPLGIYVDYAISYAAYVFLVCCFSWYFFARFEEKGTRNVHPSLRWLVTGYSVALVLLVISSIWTGWFFSMDENGKFLPTDLFNWVVYLFIPLVLFNFYVIWRYRLVLGRAETAVLVLFCALPSTAYAVDMKYSSVTAHLALTLVLTMLYTFVDAEQEKGLIRTRQELAEMSLNTMVGQINPHFIHNTLSSIESLARTRPEESRELLSLFSEYMSDNYMDMTKRPLIPFREELRHVEHYLSIEKVRFPNLTVVYDIQADDFLIPCLSVQPLAENAVKHGICRKRKSMGTLRIASEETEDSYVVTVTDDGAGFDPQSEKDRERSHIGIENTAKRLELLCGGSLDVTSIPGTGTKCRILIPKGGVRP